LAEDGKAAVNQRQELAGSTFSNLCQELTFGAQAQKAKL